MEVDIVEVDEGRDLIPFSPVVGTSHALTSLPPPT